jgi:signal transduction histidine kinase
MAHRNTGRMLDLVNHLLDIGKLESGQLPIHPEPVEVRSLMEETAERLAPLAEEAQIEVEVAVEEGLPTLEVDPDLIGRVLNNLLDNALKFTPDEGYVRMWARFDPSIDPQCVLLGVTDNGPGIPSEARSRLFRKFQQSISTQGRRMGTGLGLPFCKLAVEAHGGRIWVESEVGKGSTFMMILPLVE